MNLKRCARSMLFVSLITLSVGAARAEDNDALLQQAQQVLAAAPSVHIQATILSIDPASRMVTVRGPHRDAELVVSKDVSNFDRLHVGDKVDVDYKNALLVSAHKVTGKEAGTRERIDRQSIAPASSANGESGFQSAR